MTVGIEVKPAAALAATPSGEAVKDPSAREKIAESVKKQFAAAETAKGGATETTPSTQPDANATKPEATEPETTEATQEKVEAPPPEKEFISPEDMAKLDLNSVGKEKIAPEFRKTWDSMQRTWSNKVRGLDSTKKQYDAELQRVSELRETLEKTISNSSTKKKPAQETDGTDRATIVDMINDPDTFDQGLALALGTESGKKIIGNILREMGLDPKRMANDSRKSVVDEGLDLVRNDSKLGKRFQEFESDPELGKRLEETLAGDQIAIEMLQSNDPGKIARAIRSAFIEIEHEMKLEELSKSKEQKKTESEADRTKREKEAKNASAAKGVKASEATRKGTDSLPGPKNVRSVVTSLLASGRYQLGR